MSEQVESPAGSRAKPAGSGERNPGLELFFDLVFVLCVAQLADVLHGDPSWRTAGIVLLLFVPVWWTWTGMTFATDRFPRDDVLTTVLVLAAAGASGLMALAIPTVPGSGNDWFALGYLAVRLILATIYFRSRRGDERLTGFYSLGFVLLAVVWAVSIALPRDVQPFVWMAAIAADVLFPAIADRQHRILPVDQRHLPDRFGSFAIIVLGESAVNTVGVTSSPLRGPVVLVLAEGFALSALLWWGFFDRGAWQRRYQHLADPGSGRLAYVVCAYLHYPLVAGVAVVGAGVQVAVDDSTGPVPVSTALMVVCGTAGYLMTMNVMTWVLRVPRSSSLAPWRIGMIVALGVLLLFGRALPTPAFLAAVILVLAFHIGLNVDRDRRRPLHPHRSHQTA